MAVKTVEMERDFAYTPQAQVTVMYRAGIRYEKVPEAAVRAILIAGAGTVVRDDRR